MKQIVVSIKNDEYKIKFDGVVGKETEKAILEEATKYYSHDRLVFKDDEEYKLFTIKYKGEKYKVIVAKSDEALQKSITEIVSKIEGNTALYVCYNEDTAYFEKLTYDKIIDKQNKFYFNESRNKMLQFLKYSLIVTVAVVLTMAGYGAKVAFIAGFVQAVINTIVDKVVEEKSKDIEKSVCNRYSGVGIVRLIDLPVYLLIKSIKNTIGDIQNKTFNFKESIKRFINKFRVSKNLKKVEKELDKITKSLDEEKIQINPTIDTYNPEQDMILNSGFSTVDLYNTIEHIKSLILGLPYDRQYVYTSELEDILNTYKTSDIIANEMIRQTVISNLDVLKNKIVNELLCSVNVNDELEEYKNNKLVKARQ